MNILFCLFISHYCLPRSCMTVNFAFSMIRNAHSCTVTFMHRAGRVCWSTPVQCTRHLRGTKVSNSCLFVLSYERWQVRTGSVLYLTTSCTQTSDWAREHVESADLCLRPRDLSSDSGFNGTHRLSQFRYLLLNLVFISAAQHLSLSSRNTRINIPFLKWIGIQAFERRSHVVCT